MHVQWFAHLPGVQLESGDAVIELLEGTVTGLTFTEWCELDPSFPYSESKYNESQPVFYVGSASLEGDLKAVLNQVSERLRRFYISLLLDARVPRLPDPQLSVHYVRVNLEAGIATYRLVGPFEREWILYGNQIVYSFNAERLRATESIYELLPELEAGRTLAGIEAGIETLIRTSRPDVWWDRRYVHQINDFIHCTAALEHLLVPFQSELQDQKVVQVFGRHAAVLISKSRNGLEELSQSYAGLYRLHNNLIHGQMAMSDLNDSDLNVLRLGRILLREVIIKAMALNRLIPGKSASQHRNNGHMTIPMMLKMAYENEGYHMSLHNNLKDVKALV